MVIIIVVVVVLVFLVALLFFVLGFLGDSLPALGGLPVTRIQAHGHLVFPLGIPVSPLGLKGNSDVQPDLGDPDFVSGIQVNGQAEIVHRLIVSFPALVGQAQIIVGFPVVGVFCNG